jgi:hypothetical protein
MEEEERSSDPRGIAAPPFGNLLEDSIDSFPADNEASRPGDVAKPGAISQRNG